MAVKCKSTRLCLSQKCVKRKACENRCCGWFAADPEFLAGCKGACWERYDELNGPCDYFGLAGIEQQVILSRGYDPCPGGVSIEDVLEPWQQAGAELAQQRAELSAPLIRYLGIGIVGLIVLLLVLLYIKKRG